MSQETAKELIAFIEKSPTSFHAVKTMGDMLDGERIYKIRRKRPVAVSSGGQILYHPERICPDRLFPSKRRTYGIPDHCKPQRFSQL